MNYVCFRFCLLSYKLSSIGHYLWEKQLYDAIHSSKDLEMVCCTAWNDKDFTVLGCQFEDCAEDSFKGKQSEFGEIQPLNQFHSQVNASVLSGW